MLPEKYWCPDPEQEHLYVDTLILCVLIRASYALWAVDRRGEGVGGIAEIRIPDRYEQLIKLDTNWQNIMFD